MDRSFCLLYFAFVAFFQHAIAIRNLRRNDGNQYINPQNPISEWEHGLREAVYQTLHRQYKNPNLRNYLRAAPILGRQDQQVTPFGDIAVIARGQVYFSHSGFLFVQDPYQNDCDECHNPNPACIGEECQTWKPPNDEKLIALWTVKRIRHRDSIGGFRYELKYTISPLGNKNNRLVLRRDGRFDYNIPGQVFILRSGLNGHNLQENLQETHHRLSNEHEQPLVPIFRPSLPAPPNYIREYLPKKHSGGHYPLTERIKPSTPYDTQNNVNQIDKTPSATESFTDRHVSAQFTSKPKTEGDLYRELINILQQKTSTRSSLQNVNENHNRKYFENENRFSTAPIIDKPPSYEYDLHNHHTTSPTYATHIKKMQQTISYSLSKSKEGTTPQLILPTISQEYSKTTMYSYTNTRDTDSALSTTQTLFSNPPPTPHTTSSTTPPQKPRPTTSENKKSKSQLKLSTRLGPFRNYLSTEPVTTPKTRFSTKIRTSPSVNTLSRTTSKHRTQPFVTQLSQTTPSSKPSPELEIIPITDQNSLLTPILDLLRPIMEIMKTENPFTHYYETSTPKTSNPPTISKFTESNKYTTTSLPKQSKPTVTLLEKTKQRPTIVEIQKSETKLETVEEISPQINKTLVNAKTTNIPRKQSYTPYSRGTTENPAISLKRTTTEKNKETTTETTSTSKTEIFTTNTTPLQTFSTVLLSKETIVEINTTEENTTSQASQNTDKNTSSPPSQSTEESLSSPVPQNTPTITPKPKTSPRIMITTTKRPLLIKKINTNIPGKNISEKNINSNFANDLFGTTKFLTTTKKPSTSIEKLEESNVSILEELFGASPKTTKASIPSSSKINDRIDYDISSTTKKEESEEFNNITEVEPTPKIIFSNFFFAPTKTPENITLPEEQETQLKAVIKEPNGKSTLSIEKMKMMAHYTMNEDQEEIPTSQSVSTSISYVITKPNRTTITRKQNKYGSATMVKALVKEITNKHNDFVVFEAEFPDQNKTKTENEIETSEPDIKTLLNNITLSVVNHARAIDYIQGEKRDNNEMKNKTKVQPSTKQRYKKGVIIKTP